jgi:hypothetical protein
LSTEIVNRVDLIIALKKLLERAQTDKLRDDLKDTDFNSIIIELNGDKFPITDLTKGCVKPGGKVLTTTTAFKELGVACMVFHNIKTIDKTDMRGYQSALDIIRNELTSGKNVFTSRGKGVLEEIDLVYNNMNSNFLYSINSSIATGKLISKNCPSNSIVENADIFGRCRSLASSILFSSKGIGDKWCPGDIYLINKSALKNIEGTLSLLEKRYDTADDTTDKMSILNDLNMLFGEGDDKIYAVSLKEGIGQLGKSKSVLDPLDGDNYNLTQEELELYKTIDNKQQNSEQLEDAIQNLRDAIKDLCNGSTANAVGVFQKDNRNHKNAKEKLMLDINKSTIGDIKNLNSNGGFKLLKGEVVYHLDGKKDKKDTNLERKYKYGSLKLLLYVLCSYRTYYSPFEHITNYSQGLGANPHFWKYYGEGGSINITEYKSEMSVKLIGNIDIYDDKNNGGVYALYKMVLNDENVKVRCNFRTNGGTQLTIELSKN